jgi:hypothetical protein
MMDHERTEKELEEIFEEIQHSYKTFADDAFALQERTLQFARELLENPASREVSGRRDTLENLVKGAGANASGSRGWRGRLAKPTRGCSRALSMSIITRLSRPRQI